MLDFKTYRTNFAEDMSVPVADQTMTGTQPEPAAPEESVPATPQININQEVDQVIDKWISDLKSALINPTTPDSSQRGLWDRFKGGIANLWHGRYNQKNPYFWKNKLGDDLGSAEEAFILNPMTLEEYRSLREVVDCIENAINEDANVPSNLRLYRLIDQKGRELKNTLKSLLNQTQSPEKPPQEPIIPTSSNAVHHPAHADPAKGPIQLKEPEEEEEPSEPPFNDNERDELVMVLKTLVNDNIVDQETAQRINKALYSKDPKLMSSAETEIAKLNDVRNQQMSNKPTGPIHSNEPPRPPANEEEQRYNNLAMKIEELKHKNEIWNHSQHQDLWDDFGGGRSNSKARGCLFKAGIRFYPWILRVGDPRLKILDMQIKGQLHHHIRTHQKHYSLDDIESMDFEKHDDDEDDDENEVSDDCTRRVEANYKKLKEAGRIEDPANPIKSYEELKQLVAKIKQEKVQIDTIGEPVNARPDLQSKRDEKLAAKKKNPENKKGPKNKPPEPEFPEQPF